MENPRKKLKIDKPNEFTKEMSETPVPEKVVSRIYYNFAASQLNLLSPIFLGEYSSAAD